MPTNFTIVINVSCEKTQGKFVGKDELMEACVEEIQEPGTLYVDESEYEIVEWDVNYS